MWFSGLPASGKSTLARAVKDALEDRGLAAHILDGDEVRRNLSRDLGFSAEDRAENVRRVAEAAVDIADTGVVVLVALVSPAAAPRLEARRLHERRGIPFVEVWVSTPLPVCIRRDPKGLYARALRGELKNLTGIDDPYEPPVAAELTLDTSVSSLSAAVDTVLRGVCAIHA